MNSVFQPYPGCQSQAKDEVKEPLVRNGKDDERRREGEEKDHQAVQVVPIGIQAVEEWK